jgi:pimeloyl-ACP methyl ester carboxylesterase
MNELKIESAIIMGRSVGGRTTVEFANEYPSKVKALIL